MKKKIPPDSPGVNPQQKSVDPAYRKHARKVSKDLVGRWKSHDYAQAMGWTFARIKATAEKGLSEEDREALGAERTAELRQWCKEQVSKKEADEGPQAAQDAAVDALAAAMAESQGRPDAADLAKRAKASEETKLKALAKGPAAALEACQEPVVGMGKARSPAEESKSTFNHSPDYRSCFFRGETFSFTPIQAGIVRTLHEALKNKTPEVGDETLLDRAQSSANRPDIRDTFRGHPAWGILIIKGKTKGSRRLYLPD
jgi:hypothetical protein